MQDLGLAGVTEWGGYWSALRGHAREHTYVNVLELDGEHLASLDTTGCGGQVLVDRNATGSSRLLRLRLDDPNRQLDFDPATPDDAAVFLTHMIQVKKSVWVEAVDRLVTSTIFTGPLRRSWRDGATLRIVCHGKEQLARRPLGDTLTIEAGTPKMEAVRIILARAGETRFALPDLPAELARPLSLGPTSRPWDYAQLITESENQQLYYPAGGAATVRRWSRQPLYTFRTGAAGEVLGTPRVPIVVDDDFTNAVEVLGANPPGPQNRVRVVVPAPADSLLAAGVDGSRGGGYAGLIPRRYVNPLIDDEETAYAIGERIMDDILLGIARPRFDAQPIWPLEEGDMVELETDDVSVPFRFDRYVLPLSARGDRPHMVVGGHRDDGSSQDDA